MILNHLETSYSTHQKLALMAKAQSLVLFYFWPLKVSFNTFLTQREFVQFQNIFTAKREK